MHYCFRYRRRGQWFFRCFKQVAGHGYDEFSNKMTVYFLDGGAREISDWKNCEIKLGTDWVLFMKQRQEQASGMSIPLALGNAKA